MNLFNGLKLSNHILNILYIIILIKASFSIEFIDIKKLSLYDIYFVVLDTGLYLYDFNNEDFAKIHNFNNDEYKDNNNKINIAEIYNKNKAYIFCLVNEYLFLFNEYTYKIWKYKINKIDHSTDYYYNIMPYKIENSNISFIIALNKDITNLFFYFYNFNINEGINEPKEIIFDNMNIQNKMIRCQINSYSTFIICFYYSILNAINNLMTATFKIKNMDLSKENKFTKIETKEINEIKVATSYNNKFFICFLNDGTPFCAINDYLYDFSIINCTHTPHWGHEYKVLYFNETDDFMLISRVMLTTTILSNKDNLIKICSTNNFSTQVHAYSIIYINNYQIVNYKSFTNYNKSIDISIFANIKHYNYIKEVQYLVDNSENKEDLLKNLNELIKNNINLNYIDDNEELIIPKDQMTIAFTSTAIQKMNENSNSTTINLGKCEKKLKNIYNISKEANLYILKIDTKQDYKNYPIIEYEIFYPLNNGEIEILNLSFCEGIDIELSIPIIINFNWNG